MDEDQPLGELRELDAGSRYTPDAIDRTDAELVESARAGDGHAFESLYRRHFGSMLGFAWQYASSREQAEDIASEAFTNVMHSITEGGGPRIAVRAYLLTAVRNTATRVARQHGHEHSTSDEAVLDRPIEDHDPVEQGFETEAVARAFTSLPERWQKVLWYLDVERAGAKETAQALGMRANAVVNLAKRARDGLRKAYLHQHIRRSAPVECKPYVEQMVAYASGGMGRRQRLSQRAHIDHCEYCSAVFREVGFLQERVGMAVPLKLAAVGGFGVISAIVAKDVLAAPVAAIAAGAAATGAGASVGAGGGAAGGTSGGAAASPLTSTPVVVGASVAAAAAVVVGGAFALTSRQDDSAPAAAVAVSASPSASSTVAEASATEAAPSASDSASPSPSALYEPSPTPDSAKASTPSADSKTSKPKSAKSARPTATVSPEPSEEPSPTRSPTPTPSAEPAPTRTAVPTPTRSAYPTPDDEAYQKCLQRHDEQFCLNWWNNYKSKE